MTLPTTAPDLDNDAVFAADQAFLYLNTDAPLAFRMRQAIRSYLWALDYLAAQPDEVKYGPSLEQLREALA